MMGAMNRLCGPLNSPHLRGMRGAVVVLTAVIAVTMSGCSSDGDSDNSAGPPVITPASAAPAPPLTSAPAGTVHRFAGRAGGVLQDRSAHTVLVLSDDGQIVTLFTLPNLDAPRHTVRLPSPATAAIGDGAGAVYLSTEGGYFRLDIATGRADKVGIDGHDRTKFTAVTRRADDRIVLGDSEGTAYTLDTENRVSARATGFARIDSLASQGNTVAVLDRAQSSVTTLSEAGDGTQHALRAGEGATTMLTDDKGRLLVTDTRGGALLVFGTDALILRQRYPVPGSPYGLAYSPKLVWVSQTAANTVIGYDLSTGIPEERARFSTVRQPNSLVSDGDTLFVASAVGDGIQAIDIRSVG
ncbi:MAG: YncE family protein [Mycobacterium sp.]